MLCVLAACSKDRAPTPSAVEVSAQDRAKAAGLVGELKKSLVGALTQAMGQGVPSAIAVCHTDAPALTAKLARDGAVAGRATKQPRNPKNAATGWHLEALTQFEKLHADKQLAGATFTKRLPDGRVAYAEPLVIQELCVACHGANVAPEVTAALSERYPQDKATGYAVGDLRGIAWVELPATSP